MGGIAKLDMAKLDMMCSLYKPTLRSRRWYIHLCFHSLTVAVVNAWFLYGRNTQWIDPQEPSRTFQANVANGLASAKNALGRPSVVSKLTPLLCKSFKVQSTPMSLIRLDGIDHMPNGMKRDNIEGMPR